MRSPSFLPRGLFLASFLGALPLACTARADGPEYRTVKATEFGKSLIAERSDAKTLTAALQLTLADLTRYFGAAPSVFSAFADSKDPHAGGATFLVSAQGGQVKGLVTCQVSDAKTRVAVAYIRADAPAAEWGRLVQPPPAAATPAAAEPVASAPPAAESMGAAAVTVAAMAHVPLRTYNFPDGTGSVGLAEGWTTDAQSATHLALLHGPNDELVSAGAMYSVMGPRSTLPRGPTTLVARYGTPIEVFAALVPQFSQMSLRQSGPSLALDHLTKVADQKAGPNRQVSILHYGITETTAGGARKHYQAMGWVGVSPMPPAMFMMTLTQVRAPDATFEKMKPVMFQMVNSMKTNDAAIQRKSSAELAAQRQRFDAQQARMRSQQAANDAQHKQYWDHQKAMEESHKAFADKQNQQARSNDNFDEYIRGVRTVEDTQTGIKTSVDLGNVDKVVDTLNERDPGRYRQIPLRDEVHPQ
jgi:hypothetical protein